MAGGVFRTVVAVAKKPDSEYAPDQAKVRSAIEEIIASTPLRSSQQLQKILRFVVTEELEGRGKRIKAYSIAVDALGRPESFDPQADPAVRVDVRRLRRALDEYYEDEGKDADLIVDIPKGGYRPVFRTRPIMAPQAEVIEDDAPAAPAPGPANAGKVSTFRRFMPAAAVLFVIFGLVGIAAAMLIGKDRSDGTVPATTGLQPPMLEVAAFSSTEESAAAEQLAGSVRQHILSDLSRFRSLTVLDAGTAENNEALPTTTYLLRGTIRKVDAALRLTLNLQDRSTGRVVWSGSVTEEAPDGTGSADFPTGSLEALAYQIAGPGGALESDGMQRIRSRSDGEILQAYTDYECLLLFHEYDRRKSARSMTAAKACIDERLRNETLNGSIWAAHALMEYLDWTKTSHAEPQALNRALGAARQAVLLDPADANSHEYLGTILRALGRLEGAEIAYRRALDRNPARPDVYVSLGWIEILNGNWNDGVETVRTGLRLSHAPAGWMRIPLTIDAFRQMDYPAALSEAEKIVQAGDKRGIVLALAAAHMAGNREAIARHARLLRAYEQSGHGDPLSEIREFTQFPDLMNRYRKAVSDARSQD